MAVSSSPSLSGAGRRLPDLHLGTERWEPDGPSACSKACVWWVCTWENSSVMLQTLNRMTWLSISISARGWILSLSISWLGRTAQTTPLLAPGGTVLSTKVFCLLHRHPPTSANNDRPVHPQLSLLSLFPREHSLTVSLIVKSLKQSSVGMCLQAIHLELLQPSWDDTELPLNERPH